MKLDPKPDNPCFGCGGANPRGMGLVFEQDDARQRIVGRFRLGEEYQGGSGFLHGGIIALLLDGSHGQSGLPGFTPNTPSRQSCVWKYKRPIRVNSEIVVGGIWRRAASGLVSCIMKERFR